MQIKSVIKTVCFGVMCVAVGIFLYSRMHVEYSVETQKDKGKSAVETEVIKGNMGNDPVVFPEKFQKEVSELLIFDVEVDVSENFNPQGFHVATATRSKVDTEKVYSYFIEENEDISSVVYENYIDFDGYETPITVYENENKYLNIAKFDFGYSKIPQMDYIYNSFYTDSSVEEYNEYLYSKEENLGFMDRKEAWNEVIKALEELGVDMSTAISNVTYSLDMETMAKEEKCFDVDGNEILAEKNPNWSESDEGYYYYITQSNQGIPLYASSKLETDEEYITPMKIFQTESGIQEVNLSRWFQIEEQEEVMEFTSFENVMLTIEEKYSGTIHTNPLTVESAKLYVFTIPQDEEIYTLVPVWVCRIAEEHIEWGEDSYTSYIYMPINAITGEEMLVLEN